MKPDLKQKDTQEPDLLENNNSALVEIEKKDDSGLDGQDINP